MVSGKNFCKNVTRGGFDLLIVGSVHFDAPAKWALRPFLLLLQTEPRPPYLVGAAAQEPVGTSRAPHGADGSRTAGRAEAGTAPDGRQLERDHPRTLRDDRAGAADRLALLAGRNVPATVMRGPQSRRRSTPADRLR
jgi:hypothetical protein